MVRVGTMRRGKPLPENEIRRLARRWRKTGDETALHAMVEANMGFATSLVTQLWRPGWEFEELLSAAYVGLVVGCRRFDPGYENKLTTYVGWWIRAYILKAIMDNDGPVKYTGNKEARKVFWQLGRVHQSGSRPDTAAIAKELDVPEEAVTTVLQRRGGGRFDISFNHPDPRLGRRGDAANFDMHDLNYVHADELLARQEIVNEIRAALAALPERESEIIRRRWFEDETLQDLGAEQGVSRERARQLHDRGLKKLRSKPRLKELVGK